MEVLFTLLADRYERGSVMLTSNPERKMPLDRLQQALFPDGLEYSMEEDYSNPRIAKTFNVIEASKASPSKLAGHISGNWNPFVE